MFDEGAKVTSVRSEVECSARSLCTSAPGGLRNTSTPLSSMLHRLACPALRVGAHGDRPVTTGPMERFVWVFVPHLQHRWCGVRVLQSGSGNTERTSAPPCRGPSTPSKPISEGGSASGFKWSSGSRHLQKAIHTWCPHLHCPGSPFLARPAQRPAGSTL